MLYSGQGSSTSRCKNNGDSRSWLDIQKVGGASLHPRRTPIFHLRRPDTPHLRDLAGFFIWVDFGPALHRAYGACMRWLLRHSLLRMSRARLVCGGASFSGEAYLPPYLGSPADCMDLLVRPFAVRMGICPALVSLRGRTTISVRMRCCVRRARVRFNGSVGLDGRSACWGALVTQGSLLCGKFDITIDSLLGIVQCRPLDNNTQDIVYHCRYR